MFLFKADKAEGFNSWVFTGEITLVPGPPLTPLLIPLLAGLADVAFGSFVDEEENSLLKIEGFGVDAVSVTLTSLATDSAELTLESITEFLLSAKLALVLATLNKLDKFCLVLEFKAKVLVEGVFTEIIVTLFKLTPEVFKSPKVERFPIDV
ncbi:hypothetical protein WICPIJ_009712 [Wickerhamomyces pijperi]|uniref:Uncharacterized protein n=1 Tax=Wickerhamomyces pijperi TaxID=599730 RepID=A0A9P8PLB8_WICPI|nr:hypothetical protein WICPIJ_009712 [Wickerhamomyces pijperi]